MQDGQESSEKQLIATVTLEYCLASSAEDLLTFYSCGSAS